MKRDIEKWRSAWVEMINIFMGKVVFPICQISLFTIHNQIKNWFKATSGKKNEEDELDFLVCIFYIYKCLSEF